MQQFHATYQGQGAQPRLKSWGDQGLGPNTKPG